MKPNHYTRWKIEPIEFIRANQLDFARANIIKYIMRFDAKDGVKDLDKAQQYMDWLREDFLAKDPDTYVPTEPNTFSTMTLEELRKAEQELYEYERATEVQPYKGQIWGSVDNLSF